VIGANGTGKTTFLKTVLGEIRELSGKLLWGAKANIGYYSQNLEDLDDRNEIIQELRRVAPLADNGSLRSFLARFLFVGEDIFKKVATLSGGEKGRLALAKLIYSNKNVLILDEPTNHLDIPSREALEDALTSFDGTIITVSHDRFFLDRIATQILAFRDDGLVDVHDGNYTDYHDWAANRPDDEVSVITEVPAVDVVANVSVVATSPKDALSKNQIQRIQKRISEIEIEIPRLENELGILSEKLTLPEIATDHQKLANGTAEYEKMQSTIQDLYDEWEKLAQEIS
jgi:ATP-binding cassette subfamily F protein 3